MQKNVPQILPNMQMEFADLFLLLNLLVEEMGGNIIMEKGLNLVSIFGMGLKICYTEDVKVEWGMLFYMVCVPH